MCKFFVDIKTGKLDILSHSDEHIKETKNVGLYQFIP